MYPNPARRLWGLVSVGAATAVGVTTHDAGFVVITLFGSLLLPRILGFRFSRRWAGGHGPCGGGHHGGKWGFEQRMGEWHQKAHGEAPADAAPVA